MSKKLEAIPSIGPLGASALVASIPDPHVFRSDRDVSAWIGIVPKQNSSGGKERFGSISKAGVDICASCRSSVPCPRSNAKQLGYMRYPWLTELMERRSVKIAAIALANRNVRTVWAMMARNESYRAPKTASI